MSTCGRQLWPAHVPVYSSHTLVLMASCGFWLSPRAMAAAGAWRVCTRASVATLAGKKTKEVRMKGSLSVLPPPHHRLEYPRPLSPLVKMVGPLLPASLPSISAGSVKRWINESSVQIVLVHLGEPPPL